MFLYVRFSAIKLHKNVRFSAKLCQTYKTNAARNHSRAAFVMLDKVVFESAWLIDFDDVEFSVKLDFNAIAQFDFPSATVF
jgi:hypothetical protein